MNYNDSTKVTNLLTSMIESKGSRILLWSTIAMLIAVALNNGLSVIIRLARYISLY